MNEFVYVMLIERGVNFKKMTKATVERHVAHIRQLDDNGHLELCGPTKGFKGVAGMVVLKAANLEEADALCQREPMVTEGFAMYTLFTVRLGNRENNYLI